MLNQNKKFFANQKKYKQPTVEPVPLTKEEFDRIKKEYQDLQQERKEVMVRLQTAREMGDLSENGAYKYAKFELGNIGRKLRKLKFLLENGYVQQKTNSGVVEFGTTVTLETDGKQLTYQLVSEHESNPRESKLAVTSPLGKLLVGKKEGDQVVLKTPRGEKKYKIVSIQ